MIYIDFFIKETQERHFYKFEGDNFEITELHIGRNNYEWTGRERDETHTIPIKFTLKTNLGEFHSFDIDCGYTEGKDWKQRKYRNYKMTRFCIMDEKDGLYVVSDEYDEESHEWKTDYEFQNKITQYFENKIQSDTDFINKRYKEMKKLNNLKTDFAD
jgi:hypothetical protein